MMSLNRRKIVQNQIKLDCSDSLKHCRSSMMVNLSYTNLSNLSSNSFGKTLNNYDEVLNLNSCTQPHKKNLRHSKRLGEINHRTYSFRTCENNKILINTTALQKEHKLKKFKINNDSEQLKDAILSKTKKIFYENDECSIKTAMILQNLSDQLDVLKDDYNTISYNYNVEKDQHSSTLEKMKKTDVIISSSVSNNELSSIRDINYRLSPIIPENSKEYCHSSQLSSKSTEGFTQNNFKNIVDSEIVSFGTPLLCSTFIESAKESKSEKNEEKDISNKRINTDIRKSDDVNLDLVSMEVTSIQEHIPMNGKLSKTQINSSFIRKCNDINIKNPMQLMHSEFCLQATFNNKFMSSNKVDTQDKNNIKQSSHCNKAIEQKESGQYSSSNNGNDTKNIELSLNVNTSIDVPMKINKNNYKIQPMNKSTTSYVCTQLRELGFDKSSLTSETANTVHSSLQVNTSLDPVCINHHKRLNELSTLQDGKTLSPKFSISFVDAKLTSNIISKNSNNSKINNASSMLDQQDSQKSKHLSNNIADNKNYNNINYIGNIPSNECHLIAKSYLKSHRLISKSNPENQTILIDVTSKSDDKYYTELHNSNNRHCCDHQEIFAKHTITYEKGRKSIQHSRIILADSPITTEKEQQLQKTIIIDDSLSENELNKNMKQNICSKNTSAMCPRSRRRKLLPLYEDSEISLSPLQSQVSTPTEPAIKNKRKKFKKPITSKQLQLSGKHIEDNFKRIRDSCSEQHYNINQKLKKKSKKPRPVFSKKIIIKKLPNSDLLLQLNKLCTGSECESLSARNRYSMNEFQTKKPVPIQWRWYKSEKITIVVTGFSKKDKYLIKEVVRSLGMADIEPNVTRKTTHVVSSGIRTINLLHGIIRGCWLVSLEWIRRSMQSKKWLQPEQFEMAHFSKAVCEYRKDRELFGAAYVPELFATCGVLYVEKNVSPSCHILENLIKAAGGQITEDQNVAKIIIGPSGIKESWILDSITAGHLQEIIHYKKK